MLAEGLRDMVRGAIVVDKDHALYRGWLQKQGAKRRNWRRRYFVLLSGCLLYFVNDATPTPQGGCVIDAQAQVELREGHELVVTSPLSYTAAKDEPEEARGRAFLLQSCAGAADAAQDLAHWRRVLLEHSVGGVSFPPSGATSPTWTLDDVAALAQRLGSPETRSARTVCFADPAAASAALALLPSATERALVAVPGNVWDEDLEVLRRALTSIGGPEGDFVAHVEATHNLALAVRRRGSLLAAIELWERALACFPAPHAHARHHSTLAKACGNAYLFLLESDAAPSSETRRADYVTRGTAYLEQCLAYYYDVEPMQYATTRINEALLLLKCDHVEDNVQQAMECLVDPLVLATVSDTPYMQHFADCVKLVVEAAQALSLNVTDNPAARGILDAARQYNGDDLFEEHRDDEDVIEC